MRKWIEDPAGVRPMLATTATAPLESADLVYEPKYDGIRALASVTPASPAAVRLWSRLGNEKTAQFPEVVGVLQKWARTLDRPVLLDGEVVALDDRGEPTGFQNLQGRIHLKAGGASGASGARRAGGDDGARGGDGAEVAFIVFDLLRDGDEDVRPLPLHERRGRLEKLLRKLPDARLRISEIGRASCRERV